MAEPIVFKCHQCKGDVTVDAALSGFSVNCPYCGTPLTVPVKMSATNTVTQAHGKIHLKRPSGQLKVEDPDAANPDAPLGEASKDEVEYVVVDNDVSKSGMAIVVAAIVALLALGALSFIGVRSYMAHAKAAEEARVKAEQAASQAAAMEEKERRLAPMWEDVSALVRKTKSLKYGMEGAISLLERMKSGDFAGSKYEAMASEELQNLKAFKQEVDEENRAMAEKSAQAFSNLARASLRGDWSAASDSLRSMPDRNLALQLQPLIDANDTQSRFGASLSAEERVSSLAKVNYDASVLLRVSIEAGKRSSSSALSALNSFSTRNDAFRAFRDALNVELRATLGLPPPILPVVAYPVKSLSAVLADLAKSGFKLVYQLNLDKLPDVSYDVDDSSSLKGPFDRIAYLLELASSSGSSQFVYVSTEAFTADAKKIGVPTLASGACFQQTLSNMEVYSNVQGIVCGSGLKGNIEFWPSNYSQSNAKGVPNASSDAYDFGDAVAAGAPSNGYGSMQMHNYVAKQTLFAINHWSSPVADIGIGNRPGEKNSDWTFASNSKFYKYKLLRVYVHPKAK